MERQNRYNDIHSIYYEVYGLSVLQLIVVDILVYWFLKIRRIVKRVKWNATHFRPRVESFFIATGQYGRYGIFLTLSFFEPQKDKRWLASP